MGDTEPSRRRFGVLLPISSLPGSGVIGNLGAPAHRWLDWLRQAGATIWQILPVGPLGYGNSPYSSLSSFAVNPLLLSPEGLAKAGWIEQQQIAPAGSSDRVDYEQAGRLIEPLLRQAFSNLASRPAPQREAFEAYRQSADQRIWLDDWALYAALKADLGGRSWLDWPTDLRRREPAALDGARHTLAAEIDYHAFVQFLLSEQLEALRVEARRRDIKLLGDLPYYPALDSADVWSRPELFDLDEDGRPRQVAGVPPDAFAKTGQLWGNPTYFWERHAADGYRWWIDRVVTNLRFVDWLRLDHFRGFAAYWAVPAGERTAVGGQWLPGPGESLFKALHRALGRLPFIAEDLGHITADVRSLRRRVGLPGMRVLQFAFEQPDSEHLPRRLAEEVVVYTGTHDNDTSNGWFSRLRGAERRRVLDHLGGAERVHWSLLRSAVESRADWAVAPVQDLLGLGSGARLNTPGQSGGQWSWRLDSLPNAELASSVRQLIETSGRQTGDDEPAP